MRIVGSLQEVRARRFLPSINDQGVDQYGVNSRIDLTNFIAVSVIRCLKTFG